jgi:hypothetical protein
MDQVVVEKLIERYSHLHPLVRHRSLMKAKTVGELFDLFDSFPETMPVTWDETNRRWLRADLLQTRKFIQE